MKHIEGDPSAERLLGVQIKFEERDQVMSKDKGRWTLFKQSVSNRAKVYYDASADSGDGVMQWKIVFVLPVEFELVSTAYIEQGVELQMEIDGMIERTEVFEQKANEQQRDFFEYTVLRMPKPFKSREVLTINRWKIEKDRAVQMAFSVQHPRFPANKKYVRMLTHRADTELIRSGKETRCNMFVSIDLKGNFPKYMSKFIGKNFLKTVKKTRLHFVNSN